MAESQSILSRRSFIVGCGVAAAGAATAAPVISFAAGRVAGAPTFRAAYLAEIGRFAETLRPRFESGELRAYRDCDDAKRDDEGTPVSDSPHWELERLCAAHFGLEVARSEEADGDTRLEGDTTAAYLLLAASPRAEATIDTHTHPGYHAAAAATWDVIALARERRWYTPTPDESEDPLIGDERCEDCGHRLFGHGDGKHDKAGCHAMGCDCTVRHTPHVPGVAA
jgi:hypothetical protein